MKPNDPRLYWYLEKLEELRLKPQTKVLGLSKEDFLEYIDFLFGPITDDQGKTIFTEDFRYIPYMLDKLLKIDLQEYLKAKGNLPQEIIQAAEDLGEEGEIDRTRLEARNKVETFIKKQEQLKTANITQAQEEIRNKVQVMVKASLPGSLAKDPKTVEKLSQVIEDEIFFGCFETILPEDLSPEFLQKVTQNLIETADDLPEQLIKAEPSLPKNVAQLVQANLKNLTWSPETTATIKELNQTGFVLPRPLREKVSPAGGPPSVFGALRHPGLFLQKITLFPIAKTAEVVGKTGLDNEEFLFQEIEKLRADPRADKQKMVALEWQLYESSRFRTKNKILSYFTGLTKSDLEQFRTHLTVTRGLGTTDFRVRYIDKQIEAMARLEQRSRLARFYQRYLRFNREAGLIQPKMEVGGREVFLPRIKPISGFGQRFVSFGEQIGYYRQFVEYPGVGVIRSVPLKKFADLRSFVYRKTFQPVLARLGQTAIGQGIKSGIRGLMSKGITQSLIKAGTTLLAKLGLTKLASAIGTAIAPGIGTAIGLVAGFIIDKAKNLLSKFKQLITKPEFALGIGAIGGIIVIGVPGTMGIAIGAPLLAISGIGLAASAGGILGSATAATVAILTAFFAPLGAPIAALVVGTILGLFFLTLFIVFLTASAFIIPAKPQEEVSIYFRVTKTASRYQIPNEDLQDNPRVVYHLRVTAVHPVQITSIQDVRIVSCRSNNPPSVKSPITISPPENPITDWQWPGDDSYHLTFDPSFEDCRVCNTVKVIANIPELNKTGEITSHTACVKIGNPPEDCPDGWPTTHGYITQGPHGSYSHSNQEAIDIGVPVGTPVYATHEGEAVDSGGWGSDTVIIRGDCYGNFNSIYTHLQTRAVRAGTHVSRGTLIGTSGYAGTGPHLHYEFSNLVMAWPYIGTDPDLDDILDGCSGRADCASPYSQW